MEIAFSPKVLRERQKKLFEALPDNSLFIVFSPSPKIRSNDVEFRYRPSSRVLYLTGVKDPDTYVIFSKRKLGDGVEKKVIIFRKHVPDDLKVWIGEPTPEDDIKLVADEIHDSGKLEEMLQKLSQNTNYLFYPISEDESFDKLVISVFRNLKVKARAGVLPPRSIGDVDPILGVLRAKKDSYEISLIRKAVKITKLAIDEVKRKGMLKNGVFEYEVDSEILRVYMRFGGWEAFPTIVASGKNSVILHYTRNMSPLSFPCVIDTGAEINFYSADITRTFVEEFDFMLDEHEKIRMKKAVEIKQAVQDIQRKVISEVKAGVSFDELNSIAEKLITQFLIDYGLLKGTLDENLESKAFRVFFPHRIGHHLGLDVHDVCPYFDDNSKPYPLPDGAVITIEPGIYIPNREIVSFTPAEKNNESEGKKGERNSEEKKKRKVELKIPDELRGIGVRIEDDILVRNRGYEIL